MCIPITPSRDKCIDITNTTNIKIDRNEVMKFVKNSFQNTEKIDFDMLLKIIRSKQ